MCYMDLSINEMVLEMKRKSVNRTSAPWTTSEMRIDNSFVLKTEYGEYEGFLTKEKDVCIDLPLDKFVSMIECVNACKRLNDPIAAIPKIIEVLDEISGSDADTWVSELADEALEYVD